MRPGFFRTRIPDVGAARPAPTQGVGLGFPTSGGEGFRSLVALRALVVARDGTIIARRASDGGPRRWPSGRCCAN
jgi:hypothetical protein